MSPGGGTEMSPGGGTEQSPGAAFNLVQLLAAAVRRSQLFVNEIVRVAGGTEMSPGGTEVSPGGTEVSPGSGYGGLWDVALSAQVTVALGAIVQYASALRHQGALDASGCEIVTVALRRADLSGKGDPFANILDFIDPKKYLLLPNTSGAMNAEEAVRLARLAAAAGLPQWVKLEIHPDPRYLLPDPIETLKAAEILVREGFTVLPYINADPVLAKRLQDVGTATVMPRAEKYRPSAWPSRSIAMYA
jgi:hypothetical protein